MAKFFYRMQNILDVKYKLEEQAKQEYMSVRVRLDEAMDVLHAFENRKDMYMDEYRNLVSQKLKVLEIEECKNAIILMDEYILEQNRLIDKIQNELDLATKKLNHAMQERTVHEKLKEKQFETFLQELNLEEIKEIDELVSYQYNEKEE